MIEVAFYIDIRNKAPYVCQKQACLRTLAKNDTTLCYVIGIAIAYSKIYRYIIVPSKLDLSIEYKIKTDI